MIQEIREIIVSAEHIVTNFIREYSLMKLIIIQYEKQESILSLIIFIINQNSTYRNIMEAGDERQCFS